MDLRRLLLSPHRTKLPRLKVPGLQVISESPCEDTGQVELRMANRRLVLVGADMPLSLTDFIDRQFSPRPRLSLLQPVEKRRRVVGLGKGARTRLRLF